MLFLKHFCAHIRGVLRTYVFGAHACGVLSTEHSW